MIRKICALGLACLFVVASSAFVAPQGDPVALEPGKDFPDPVVVATNSAGTSAQIYATGGTNNPQPPPNDVPINIIEESWAAGTSFTRDPAEALPQLPPHAMAQLEYAPAVYLFGDHYIMWYTAASSRQCFGTPCNQKNELFSATSPTSHRGPFNPTSEVTYFSGTPGLYDPSFAFDTNNSPYLFYVTESADLKDNFLMVQKLAPSGDTFDPNTGPMTLFSYDQFYSQNVSADFPKPQPGDTPVMENPVMAYEPRPYFDNVINQTDNIDLYMSVGSYYQDGAYRTYEIGCASIFGPCDYKNYKRVDSLLVGSSNPQNVTSAGGEAFLEGSGINFERFTIFHANKPGPPPPNPPRQLGDRFTRSMYVSRTNLPPAQPYEASLRPGQSLTAGQCLCNFQTGWFAQFTSGGDLTLYDGSGTVHWHSATSGSGGVFAKTGLDGNFAVYDGSGPAQNPSNTSGHPGARLVLTNNNNLAVVDTNGTLLTSTMTGPPG